MVGALVVWVAPVAAQTSAHLDVGGSVVEYDGFLRAFAASFAPAVQYDGPNVSFGARGSGVVFETGNTVFQGTVAGSWFSRPSSPLRVEFGAVAGLARYSEADAFGHLLGRFRVHYHGRSAGGWSGITTGVTQSENSAAPIEWSAGFWTVRNRTSFVGTVTASIVGSDTYVDVLGAIRWAGPRLELNAVLGARPASNAPDVVGAPRTQAFGELTALVRLTDRLLLSVSGGHQPGDPTRSVRASTFLTLGFRVRLFRGDTPLMPVIAGAAERAARAITESDFGSRARLELDNANGVTTVRVHAPGADGVELMGDFTDWQPVSLESVGDGIFELPLSLEPGAYRLNIRINGGAWRVPLGARLEENEFGGAVGVVVIHASR